MDLISPDGSLLCGLLDEPIERINHRDYDLLDPFGRPVRGLRRRLAFNRFEFLGGLSDALIFGVAMADVGYVSTAFLYLFEPKTGTMCSRSLRTPLSIGTTMADTPERGTSSFVGLGGRVEMSAIGNARRLKATARGVKIDATFSEGAMTPQRICTRTGPSGWVYARKTAGHSITGSVEWDGRRIDLSTLSALGHHDWSAGYMRRETFWNWGCLAGRLADGRVVGMNISCGVNETSFTENCFWLDGALHRIGPVHFDYERRDLGRPWRMTDSGGHLDLTFTPAGRHVERINALIVASNFTQMFGHYDGTFTTDEGEVLTVSGMPGYAEWHFARW